MNYNSILEGKHIVLGITGGIAAYKSAALCRLMVKAGAQVQVIMTPNAREFITPVTLSTLSGRPVITEFFTANTGQWNSHVDLGLWADAMVIAPATASTIAKMATGVADNMLVTSYLSTRAPVFIAPAMDLDMMAHPTTVRNLSLLRSYGNHIIEAATGELASHLTGKGRMEEPERIVKVLEEYFGTGRELAGKRVLITAGPTVEKLDPVRYLSNFSSGKMGFALAAQCAARGANVTLVAGPVSLSTPAGQIERVNVTSALEMHDAVTARAARADVVILCAAVADYRAEQTASSKIKRDGNVLTLTLVPNPDIAAAVGRDKRDGQLIVGFALETDNGLENARAKMVRKKLDMIVLNSAREPNAGFQADNNTITIIDSDGTVTPYDNKPKTDVAADIVDHIVSLMHNS
ncbi:MAG: bifunctional phosphopantothenoylcysteine decarboxylase/phosphopantothenate--cysteine ligase CoaBC [Muribaculaceae bacterium]|nr:bifunctional phosphopantothenoylcysteine decarboxylase/phosphopantothenate--cysteine ligase CoaBC [Muribaculaceae bacterium]